jgi:hypothetical protein
MTGTYEARSLRLTAVFYDGTNQPEVARLLEGTDSAVRQATRGFLILDTPDRADRVLEPGSWVSVHGGRAATHSDPAFRRLFREVL